MTSPAQHQPQTPTTSTPAAPTVRGLQDLLWDRFEDAGAIKRRLSVVKAFVDELDRVRRGKRFRHRNNIVWDAVVDVYDKLVIDLCSLSIEMRHGMPHLDGTRASHEFLGKRGLFIEIRDHHLASITRTYVPHPDDNDDEVSRYNKSKAETFARLFPNCTGNTPGAADIELLCEAFRVKTKPLKDDRNKNRAHAYEQARDDAKLLWLPELEGFFDYTQQLLEDLSSLSGGPAYDRTFPSLADRKETAADMVDLVLLGNISDVQRLTATRTRDELYARLHEIDDAMKGERERLHFNDRQFGPPFDNDSDALWPGAIRKR